MIYQDLPEPKTASRYYDELLSQIVHFIKYLNIESDKEKRKQLYYEIVRLKRELFRVSKLENTQLIYFDTILIQSKLNHENNEHWEQTKIETA